MKKIPITQAPRWLHFMAAVTVIVTVLTMLFAPFVLYCMDKYKQDIFQYWILGCLTFTAVFSFIVRRLYIFD